MTSCDSTALGLVSIMEVLDVLVEKIQGTENDDIAVLLLGYEEWPHLALIAGEIKPNASSTESKD